MSPARSRFRILHSLSAALCFGSLLPAGAATPPFWSIDVATAQSKVEFLAIGSPSALKIRGRLDDNPKATGLVRYDGKQLSAQIQIPLNGFSTGIALRDKHMKEKYLETEKWPTAELSIPALPSATADGKEVPFQGILSLRGTQGPVTGIASLSLKEGKAFLAVRFSFGLSKFGISVPSLMGITVSEKVDVEAETSGVLASLP